MADLASLDLRSADMPAVLEQLGLAELFAGLLPP